MRISRIRYYVFREGGREVWCGSGKTLHFKPVAKLGDTQLKSYATEAMAERAMKLTDYEDYEIRKMKESVSGKRLMTAGHSMTAITVSGNG